jgi:D-amino-acid dehydrogenase
MISPGYSSPWAAPGIPLKAIKWMLSKHSPLIIRLKLDPAMWRWIVKLLGNCTATRYQLNKSRMMRVAAYSREAFKALRAETGIQYDERTLGTLQLFRRQRDIDSVRKDMAVLECFNMPYELLDAEGCTRVEPALGVVKEKIAGGLRLPLDETGDCFRFTQSLQELIQAMGVRFYYGTPIVKMVLGQQGISSVHTENGEFTADAFVVAMGSYSPLLLRPLGIDIPVFPVKGYSLTMPIVEEAAAPVSTVMDETHKVAITRLGQRIRVAGTAELAGYDLRLRESRRRMVEHVVTDLFPRGGDVAKASFWTGLRPMTPDGTPIIGSTPIPNLYLNTGHGTLGWTMSCGSGRLLADIISGRKPEIGMDGLTLERYCRSLRGGKREAGKDISLQRPLAR